MHRISLHGGHSGEFCEHARGSLRETLEAAVDFGFHTFGVSEHAPRVEDRFLYSDERAKGYDVARLEAEFEAYASEVDRLREEFSDRLVVLKGFEAEVVPDDRYIELMHDYRARHEFEFMVGSVHYVHEIQIDGSRKNYDRAVELCGDWPSMAIAYYETVAKMVGSLAPDVVGHLDLIRKNAPPDANFDHPGVLDAASHALGVIRGHGAILDLNTAGYRKGLGSPYPAADLVRAAQGMGIGFCFGVDSHGPEEVGAGIEEARGYLLENGVHEVTGITRDNGQVIRRSFPLA